MPDHSPHAHGCLPEFCIVVDIYDLLPQICYRLTLIPVYVRMC